jgi:bifunctional polynucleotide phosphatase/kinase
VDAAQSFYVGDAAGRPKGWALKKKKDFSDSDRAFAHNIGLRFYSPEEFWHGHAPVSFEWGDTIPTRFSFADASAALLKASSSSSSSDESKTKTEYAKTTQELVIFTGSPACGKSTFAQKHFVSHGYAYVNQDTLGSLAKCVNACEAALAAGKSCVIDNTNSSPATRGRYVAKAQAAGVPVRSFVFDVDKPLVFHLNLYRESLTEGARKRLPAVAIHSFFKNVTPPSAAEDGIDEIVTIKFGPPRFSDARALGLFFQKHT